MVDSLTSLGAAANILQFAVYATDLIKRLHDFHSAATTSPKAFQDLKVRLPLMLLSLEEMQTKIRKGHFSKRERAALEPVLDDCRVQIAELDRLLGRVLPVPGRDGVWTRAGKAVASMTREKRIAEISEAVDRHLQALALQRAAHARWPGFRRAGKIVWMTVLTSMRLEKG